MVELQVILTNHLRAISNISHTHVTKLQQNKNKPTSVLFQPPSPEVLHLRSRHGADVTTRFLKLKSLLKTHTEPNIETRCGQPARNGQGPELGTTACGAVDPLGAKERWITGDKQGGEGRRWKKIVS